VHELNCELMIFVIDGILFKSVSLAIILNNCEMIGRRRVWDHHTSPCTSTCAWACILVGAWCRYSWHSRYFLFLWFVCNTLLNLKFGWATHKRRTALVNSFAITIRIAVLNTAFILLQLTRSVLIDWIIEHLQCVGLLLTLNLLRRVLHMPLVLLTLLVRLIPTYNQRAFLLRCF